MSKFYIGQKIICVGDYSKAAEEFWARELCIEFPTAGQVYTVRGITRRPYGDDELCGVLLEEVLNMPTTLDASGVGGYLAEDDPNNLGPGEIAFLEDDFRPLLKVADFVDVKQRVTVPA